MRHKDRRVTIVVHTDGELASRQYRLPLWAFEAGKWSALVIGLLIVLFFAFAGPIGRAAARVPGLEREIARLEAENSRVQQLAAALNRAESNYQELRSMLGVKALPDKPVASPDLMHSVAVRARPPSAPLRYESGTSEPTHWPLDIPHRQPEVDRLPGERRGETRILEREQRARMPNRQPAVVQQGEHRRGELQEPEGIRDGRAVTSHRIGHVLLREVELGDESFVPAGFVHGGQIVALQVLDQRERQHGAVVHLALHGGDLLPAERLAGTQPPLAGDQLEAAASRRRLPHDDRLQQTRLADRRRELVELCGVDVAARLIGVGTDVGDGQLDETALALRFLARRSEQGFEPSAETTTTRDGFRHAGTSGSGSAAGGAGEAEAADEAARPPRSTRRMSSCATAR